MTAKPILRKELGQHHLSSGALVRPMLEFLELDGLAGERARHSKVFEIGPGGGVLTMELLRSGARVVAMELDHAWAFELRRRLRHRLAEMNCAPEPVGVGVVIGDALDLDWSRFGSDWSVAGNLPYGVATAMLQRALATAPAGTRLAFLVQLEVAQRICAVPGDRQYGALSVLVRARTKALGPANCGPGIGTGGGNGVARLLGRVKPGSFVPPPKVESAFFGLQLVEAPVRQEDWRSFTKIVFAGFSQRRKTLGNALSSRFDKRKVVEALDVAGIGSKQRAEEIDVRAWVDLWRELARR